MIFRYLLISSFNALGIVIYLMTIMLVPALLLWFIKWSLTRLGFQVDDDVLLLIYLVLVISAPFMHLFMISRSKPEKAKRLIQNGKYEQARLILETEISKPRALTETAKILADLYFQGLGGTQELGKAAAIYDTILLGDSLAWIRLFKDREPSFKPAENMVVSESLANLTAIADLGDREACLR